MGREVRRVPLGWEHPRDSDGDFQPMHNSEFEKAMSEWLTGVQLWLAGGFDAIRKVHTEYDPDQPLTAYVDYHGGAPEKEYYRPRWKEEPTAYQMYETVSEGTPVSPVFATAEELVDYLVAKGEYSDQRCGRGGWDRVNAEAFVKRGFAPSMMVTRTADGVTIKTPRDGI